MDGYGVAWMHDEGTKEEILSKILAEDFEWNDGPYFENVIWSCDTSMMDYSPAEISDLLTAANAIVKKKVGGTVETMFETSDGKSFFVSKIYVIDSGCKIGKVP